MQYGKAKEVNIVENALREIEAEGRNKDEAVKQALDQLCPGENEEYEVEVLDEGREGFLGLIGGRPTRVRVKILCPSIGEAREFIDKIIELSEVEADIAFERRGKTLTVEVNGDDVGILIGRRGQTLNAIQHLLNVMINKKARERLRVRFNVAGYRQNREQALQELAGKLASTVKSKGKKVELEPMRSYERRAIHVALKDDNDIVTYSKGEEPHRKVVISNKRKNQSREAKKRHNREQN